MAKKGPAVDWLRGVSLFEDLSQKELKLLLGHLREEWFNAGDEIVRADDPGGRLYIVTEGRAKVLVKGRNKRTLAPGDYFGEMSLIDDSPRAATVRADTAVKTLWLGRQNFLALLEDNWSMTRKVLGDLCQRIRTGDRSETL
jgi:CRP-like cAMP-binding protein